MKKHVLLLAILLPMSAWGIFSAIRDLNRKSSLRLVLQTATEKASLLGAEYPKIPSVANLRIYGAAMEKVDVSATPPDFQAAFRDWARAWTESADLMEREGASAKQRAEERVRTATAKLNAAKAKYGV